MAVRMRVIVPMAVRVGMIGACFSGGCGRMGMRVLVAVAVPQVVRDLAVLAAVARQAAVGQAGLQVGHALLQQLEDLALHAEMARLREAHLRVLRAQVLHLAADALHQRAGVEVVRQHHDLLHAQQHLALHHALQARPGDAGEGDLHQFMVAVLLQPARHLGDVAVGLPVGRAAAQQHHAGGGGVRYVQRLHAAAQLALQDREDGLAGREVRPVQELHARAVRARMLDGFGNFHLHVAGRVQDERQHQDAAAALGGQQQAVVQARWRELDEAHLDAPAGPAFAPLAHEGMDFVVALGLARAVADQQHGGSGLHGRAQGSLDVVAAVGGVAVGVGMRSVEVRHRWGSGVLVAACGAAAGTSAARRKRWVKPGS